MNRTITVVGTAAVLLFLAGTSCTDPTVTPKSSISSSNVFDDPNSYRAFIAKIYGGLIVTGQRGPDGNADIRDIDEGFSEYLRLYWYLQEMPTDEAVIGWGDPGLATLNRGTWGDGNEMVNAMFARIFYQIMLANEFLRQSTDAKLDSRGQMDPTLRTNVHFYRAEARFLRALSYAHGIDLFGNIPLVTENDPLGSTPPAQATRVEVYAYVVSELNDIISQLPPRGANAYGRATADAAHMLLANLYLNANIYTGTPNYSGALAEAQTVISSSAGYTIDTSFAGFLHNFQADNNTSPELIFVAAQDGNRTQTWGGMTFLIHAGCGGQMQAPNYGIDYCWGGYRMKQQTYSRFAAGDRRGSIFFTTGQQVTVDTIEQFSNGIAAPKFTNIRSAGGRGAQSGMVDTDFPIFRLAEAYLIYTEANLRGGGGNATDALNYFNALRVRAYGNATGVLTAGQLTVDTVLAERNRELLFEAKRRTDLVRFGLFQPGSYVWAWKGGVAGGTALASGRDLYPIPANELILNPNLQQNPGY
jgi:hypothetical protein